MSAWTRARKALTSASLAAAVISCEPRSATPGYFDAPSQTPAREHVASHSPPTKPFARKAQATPLGLDNGYVRTTPLPFLGRFTARDAPNHEAVAVALERALPKYQLSPEVRSFVRTHLAYALALEQEKAAQGIHIPAAAALVKGGIESNWGASRLTRQNNNLFGIKCTPSQAEANAGCNYHDTHEYVQRHGRLVRIATKEPFKTYDSWSDSWEGFAALLERGANGKVPAYQRVLAQQDPEQFLRELGRSPYQTDPTAATQLPRTLRRTRLAPLVAEVKRELASTYALNNRQPPLGYVPRTRAD